MTGSPRRAAAFAFAALALLLPAPPARGAPPEGSTKVVCQSDAHCPKGESCTAGTCAAPGTRSCRSESDCPVGERCEGGSCERIEPGRRAPVRLGVAHRTAFGLGGSLPNTTAPHAVGLEIAPVLSSKPAIVRYSVTLAYSVGPNVCCYAGQETALRGGRVEPATVSVDFPLLWEPVRLSAGPAVMLLGVDIGADRDIRVSGGDRLFLLHAGTGVSAQISLGIGPMYLAVAPLGVEVRFFSLFKDESRDDLSYNFPVRAALGLEL